ncbi:MAG: caspase family protein [Burkholderiaceae bacterium]
MLAIDLIGAETRVALGEGIALRPQGLAGRIRVSAPSLSTRDLATAGLLPASSDPGLSPGPVIELPTALAPPSRSLNADPAVAVLPSPQLEVKLTPGQAALVLTEDTAGALRWLVPERIGGRGLASADEAASFVLPLTPKGERGLGSVAHAVLARLQPFLYEITDPLLGPIIRGFARKWESVHRPCFTRRLGPDDFRSDDPSFPPLAMPDWAALAKGPALLFVHGTFSTSAAFQGLSVPTMTALSAHYGGRMAAFNHPSLSADPRENALAFLAQIPTGVRLTLDIVCHSRGGLVARQIEILGRSTGKVDVRRIVFVAAANAGTPLADPDHVVDYIDRLTTLARLLPTGPANTMLDAVILGVKLIAHGLLEDLDGLAAMNPGGEFLKSMNAPGATSAEYFALDSDFEPQPGTPLFSLTRLEDAAADSVFDQVANDLVVPQAGVFAGNGASGFPIDSGRRLDFGRADGVIHTEFFSDARTGRQILAWLTSAQAPADAGRSLAAGLPLDQVSRIVDQVRDRILLELQAGTDGGRGLAAGARGSDFTADELARLRPHVVSLSNGRFQTDGLFNSTPGDVDAIVHEHIPAWAAQLPQGEKLRIAIWAHGGLIGEADGLRIAQKHIDWWKRNAVYPLYFVWETGLFDALRSILTQIRNRVPALGSRDIFDYTSDPLIELGARALGGGKIWGAMKHNAELCSAPDGGARYTAQRLAELVSGAAGLAGRELEFHAIGHSAGSIFHSWFLPMALESRLPGFETLQLLAPAITVAEFNERLLAQIGPTGAARRVDLFTMRRDFEEADDCASIYRKSLLYLIHHALEPARRTPILGLETSIRADPRAAALFGLVGPGSSVGRVVWSVTSSTTGNSASTARHHGDFDDDIPTLNSVAANVLGERTARVSYPGSPETGRALDAWPVSDEWLRGVDLRALSAAALLTSAAPGPITPGPTTPGPAAGPGGVAPAPLAASAPPAACASAPAAASAAPRPTEGNASQPSGPATGTAPSAGGARRALCIGIDAYPAPNTLSGCVRDTELWRDALEKIGFAVNVLPNERATRQAILEAAGDLIRSARAGDVLVLHYSGHGTRVPDLDGDERDGFDEALVPFDFHVGAFLIDDDLRTLFDTLPAGVNLTCFIDCCHSGSITRMLGFNAGSQASDGSRYLKYTPQWDEWMRAHERFRQRERSLRALAPAAARGFVDAEVMRWVDFSACDATEKAYETDGSGDFTRLATQLLGSAVQGASNREFQDQLVKAFGERRRQTPQLDCAIATQTGRLLQPLS